MANFVRASVPITIASTASDVTFLPPTGFLNGKIHNLIYTAGTVPFTSNADITVTVEATSQVVMQTVNLSTGSLTFAPRQSIASTTGGTTAVGGDYFVLANDRLKITVVDATVANTATFAAIIDGIVCGTS